MNREVLLELKEFLAERTAQQLDRPVTIWKVGSISEFKWMEVK